MNEQSYDIVIIGAGLSGLISNYVLKKNHTIKILERNLPLGNSNRKIAFYCHKFLDDWVTPQSFDVSWSILCANTDDYLTQQQMYAKKIFRDIYGGNTSIKTGIHKGYHIDTKVLLENVDIQYDCEIKYINVHNKSVVDDHNNTTYYDTLISTIPMPTLVKLVDCLENIPPLTNKPIYYTTMQSAFYHKNMKITYYPDPALSYYRVTQYKYDMIFEYMKYQIGCSKLYPGKIYPAPQCIGIEQELNTKQIYLIGRYAKWIPKYYIHNVWDEAGELSNA